MKHTAHPTSRIAPVRKSPVLFAIVLALASLAGCNKPTLPGSISKEQAARIAAASAPEVRDVRFGNRFTLLGAVTTLADDGATLELAWKSTTKERLHCHVAIHIVDDAGKVLAQSDYEQSKAGGDVQPDMIWRDTVVLTRDQLQGATAIAVGLMEAGEKWLNADRGPRDWEDRRLLIPLTEKVPPAAPPSPFEGFLEGVNVKQIVGWVWNKEQPATTVEVEILDGEQILMKVPAADFRADLQTNKIGDGKHGFLIPTPEQLKDGAKHSVHVRVAGTRIEIKNSPRVLAVPKK